MVKEYLKPETYKGYTVYFQKHYIRNPDMQHPEIIISARVVKSESKIMTLGDMIFNGNTKEEALHYAKQYIDKKFICNGE